MKAYNENYLRTAKRNLANAFDYLFLNIKIDKKLLLYMFINSKYTMLFENGDPGVIAGMSGIEFIDHILYDNIDGYKPVDNYIKNTNKRSREYWLGYYLAEYQWKKGISFREIFEKVNFDELLSMYKIYHEMDIIHFIDEVDKRINKAKKISKLKLIRENRGLSQSELSKMSGVNIRSIQMYEQMKNDIKKAESETLANISKALGCREKEIL